MDGPPSANSVGNHGLILATVFAPGFFLHEPLLWITLRHDIFLFYC